MNGYLREHSSKASGVDGFTGFHRNGLDDYLKVIYPGVDWLHSAYKNDEKKM